MNLTNKPYSGTQYDFDNNIIMNHYAKRIMRKIPAQESVLDLGIGHGITTNLFYKFFADYTVVDASEDVISLYKQNFPGSPAEIVKSYFESYSPIKYYNNIIMGFILEHVDNPLQILKHYSHFLPPGGKIYVIVPNSESLNRLAGHYAGLISDLSLLSEHDLLCGHKRYYNLNTLYELVTKAGYAIESVEGIYLKPLSSAQMQTLDTPIIDAFCQIGIKYPEISCAIMLCLTLKN